MEEGSERTWSLTKRSYTVHAVVTAPLYDAMLRVLDSGAYLNLSEYLVDIIEKDVAGRGIELAPLGAFGGEDVVRHPEFVDGGVVSTRVPFIMMGRINGLLASGLFIRVSDYLRYVIKEDLESRGIEPVFVEVGEGEPAGRWKLSETVPVSTQVPMAMMEKIEGLLASGLYLRVSDYLIDLIRKDLEARIPP